ncbi:possible CBS domain-containing protein [Actinomycetales bacterium JB111]|nr:possible CBS domain-containing protein [Actinomycetales bacterium JB111]
MSPLTTVILTVVLIVLSALFVATEFSLVSSKRHRIEELAPTSRSARAALRSATELPILLAASQLGITVCTLALGATTKPAVHHALTPVFESTGLPTVAADVVAFILALVLVTFLHLVVGEMAPKSWAIAHPEKSAMMLALPMRGFMWVFRPILISLNHLANWFVRRSGVEPVSEVSEGQDPEALRELVQHSTDAGVLDPEYGESVNRVLDLRSATIGELAVPGDVSSIPAGATAKEAQQGARESGHLRLLVGSPGAYTGVVHVRDTLAAPSDDSPITPYVRPLLRMAGTTPLAVATNLMRIGRHHLALVTLEGGGSGVVTMADLLPRLLDLSKAHKEGEDA